MPTPERAGQIADPVVHPVWVLAHLAARGGGDLGTIDLDQMKPTRVQVLTPQGAPADPSVRAVFCSLDGQPLLDPLALDRVGRVQALLPPESRLIVCAWSRRGFAIQQIDSGTRAKVRMVGCGAFEGRVSWKKDNRVAAGILVRADLGAQDPTLRAFANSVVLTELTDGKGRFAMPLYPGLEYYLWRVEAQRGTEYIDNEARFVADTDAPDDLHLLIK